MSSSSDRRQTRSRWWQWRWHFWARRAWQRLVHTKAGIAGVSVLVTVGLLTISIQGTLAQRRLEAEQQRQLVAEKLKGLEAALFRELPAALALSEGLRNIVAKQGEISDDLFDLLAERFLEGQTLIRGVTLVRGSIIERTYPSGPVMPKKGVDLAQHPQRAGVIAAIRASRSGLTLGPMSLIEGGSAIIAYTPIFRDGGPAPSQADRYWGAVAVLLDQEQLFARLESAARTADIRLAVRAHQAPPQASAALWGDPGLFEERHVASRFPLPGAGEWELAAIPRGGWLHWSRPTLAQGALSALLSVGIGLLAHLTLRSRARIRLLALHDPLTRLPNRRLFQDRLHEALQWACHHRGTGALLLIDLDGFKAVNDRLGHPAGDHVLRTVADRMRDLLREPDLVARTGGDEFAALLHGVDDPESAREVADRLVRAIAQPIDLGDTLHRVGASVGIALFPRDGLDMLDLLVRTDQALYRVKQDGRNGYAWVGEEFTWHSDHVPL
jgi:diguanylate cyclase (GGDEF)-like protein